jgi:hypothetical protein
MLANIGDQYVHANPMAPAARIQSPFHSTVAPGIPVQPYLVYVAMNGGLSDHQAVIVLVLIERLCNTACARGLPIVINSLTIHR